jgi:hypothetical protein
MTTSDLTPSTIPLRGGSLAARACIPGTVLSIGLVAAALFLVSAELRSYVVGGGLLAMVAGALGGFLLARAAAVAPTDPRNGPMFVQSLVLDFGIQFLCVVAGVLVLHFLGVKFEGLAAFGVTYAAVTMVVHVAGALLLNRALSMRARHRES